MVAQRFASITRNPAKERASRATFNVRCAILSSFYDYAMSRYLLQPVDDADHVMNPLKIVSREKVQAYQGIHWLEPEDAQACLRKIDRSNAAGQARLCAAHLAPGYWPASLRSHDAAMATPAGATQWQDHRDV